MGVASHGLGDGAASPHCLGHRPEAPSPQASAPVSCLRPCQKLKIPTVDHVDTLPGQYSVIEALAGAEGHFGLGGSASQPFAPLTEKR